MKRSRGLLPLLASVVLVAGFVPDSARAADPEPSGAPRLTIDNAVVDLGLVIKGQVAEARFALRNLGDGTLHILGAKPG